MTDELKQKAENFIIERYKIAECYREDNAETREYMRSDVHSEYEEEYQLYLSATKELQKENTELKKKKEEIEIMIDFCKACKKMHTDNLTKAKELLKRWVNSYGYIDVALCNQTDQFISKVEK